MSQAIVISKNLALNEVTVLSKVPLEDEDVFLCVDKDNTYHALGENQLEFLDTKPVTQLEAFINNMNTLAGINTVESPFIKCAARLAETFKEKRGYGYEKI